MIIAGNSAHDESEEITPQSPIYPLIFYLNSIDPFAGNNEIFYQVYDHLYQKNLF